MESNINFTEISKYSHAFTEAVFVKKLGNREYVAGDEILKLTAIQQINLFIIYELQNAWREESFKLESPFFDYSSSEVQEALKKFMNTLSKNIKVKKDDLKPLLQRASEKALLIIFSPYQYYKNEIDRPGHTRLKVAKLEEMKKYVKINRHLLDHYLERLHGEHIEELFSDDALRIFDEVCENTHESPDDFESFIPTFSEMAPLNINLFYQEPDNEVREEESGQKVEVDIRRNEEEEEPQNNLNESLRKEVETLADAHERKKIDGIKKNITINQRFMFVNELFEGNADEFESVVNFLDNCEEKKDAMSFIQVNCIEGKGWDKETEEVQEFIQIVKKRFSEN